MVNKYNLFLIDVMKPATIFFHNYIGDASGYFTEWIVSYGNRRSTS